MPVSLKDGNGVPFLVAAKTQADGSQVEASLVYMQNPAGAGSDALPVSLAQPLPITLGTVTSRQNAGFSAPGQSIKNYTGNVATSASVNTVVTLETVTTGKLYVITDIVVSANNTVVFLFRIQASNVDIFTAFIKGDTAPLSIVGLESQPNASAGQTVTLLIPPITGAPTLAFYIGGFEQ